MVVGDARRLAEGEVRFCADAVPRPHLHARLVWAPLAPARVEVDLAPALAVPEVVAVLGPEDDPGVGWTNNPHGGPPDLRVLTDAPRWVGEPVAAVVATSRAAADRAADRVRVTVTDEPAALAGSAVEVVDRLGPDPADRAEPPAAGGVDGLVLTDRFRFEAAAHGPIEPPSAGAWWDADASRWLVCTTTQTPQLVAQALRALYGLAPDELDVVPVAVGGGFGLKEDIGLDPAALLLSRACGGRAVLLEPTRGQVAAHHRRRFAVEVELRTVADHAGELHRRDLDVLVDGGPIRGHAADLAGNGAFLGASVHPAPEGVATARVRKSTTTPGAGFRGYGGLEALTAVGVHMHRLAAELGVDHAELLARSVLRTGQTDARGEPVPDLRAAECVQRAAEALRARREAVGSGAGSADGRLMGRGLAIAVDTSGAATSPDRPDSATVRLRVEGGRVVVETAVVEIGSGVHALLRVLVARRLQLPEDRVAVEVAGGAGGAPDNGVYGSRGAHVTGSAGCRAADALLALAREWSSEPASLAEALDAGQLDGRVVDGVHVSTGPGLSANAVAAEVLVDPLTGETEVTWVHSTSDIGLVLDPRRARGQVIGGVMQGIGVALHESDAGRAAGRLLDHVLPCARSHPEIEVELLDIESGTAPSGAKGLGELAIMAVPAALANALADATGSVPTTFPVTPERVLALLEREPSREHGGRATRAASS